jgi:hypothetical protein
MRFSLGVAALGLAVAACNSDTTNAPLATAPLTQADAQAVSDEMQTEMAGITASSSTAEVMGCRFGFFPGAFRLFHGPFHFGNPPADCPTANQNPPVDTDGDGVPDDLILTFDPTKCVFTDRNGLVTMELSGALEIIDPPLATQGLRLVFTQLQQKVSLPNANYFQRTVDGPWQLSSDASGFLAHDTTTVVNESSTRPTSSLAKQWAVTFTVTDGSTYSPHMPLPSGDFNVDGTTTRTWDTRTRVFQIETVTVLHRDATCSAENKIVSGELHVTTTNSSGTQTVDIIFNPCGQDPTVTLVT